MKKNLIQLKCDCGAVQGEIRIQSVAEGTRLTCMCADCQLFANYLGKADKTLNSNGGVSIYQITPNRIKILQGKGYLTCVKLSRKGPHR